MESSRQECWSGLPFPSPRDLPHPGIELRSPALQTDALPSEPPGKSLLGLGILNNSCQVFPVYCQSLTPTSVPSPHTPFYLHRHCWRHISWLRGETGKITSFYLGVRVISSTRPKPQHIPEATHENSQALETETEVRTRSPSTGQRTPLRRRSHLHLPAWRRAAWGKSKKSDPLGQLQLN